MIILPEALWASLLDAFAACPEGVERVGFLDGLILGETAVVTTIVVPNAALHWGYYDVPAEAMSQAGQHFRRFGLARIAQVHTHGDANCRHSRRDDAKAYSQREGAVSIVLPYHAMRRPAPSDGTMHVRTARGWMPLSRSKAIQAVLVVPAFLDFRSTE